MERVLESHSAWIKSLALDNCMGSVWISGTKYTSSQQHATKYIINIDGVTPWLKQQRASA